MGDIDYKALYTLDPPPFGEELKAYYALDPEYINLNNGSYGTTPKPVLQAVHELTKRIEANPDLFHRLTYQPMLIDVRKRIAKLIGAKADEVVLVTNASLGLNIVLRNFDWEEGDAIFAFTTTYNSISRTAHSIGDVPPHPTVHTIPLNFPTTHEEIASSFKEFLRAHRVARNKKRVAIIDSIVSNPGVLLPWQEMVKIAKEEGVWSVVDAAHSIGQEVGVNLTESAPDFWISNNHKWLSAKRSSAVLYVPERNQHIVTTSIPTSYAYISPKDRTEPNFVPQYEWNGTIDWSSHLTVADALDFRAWLGGEAKINAYCHALALKGGKVLAEILGTQVVDPDGDLTLNMVNVELPLPPVTTIDEYNRIDIFLKERLLTKYKAYSAHFFHNERWWTRCSAQVFNTIEDFEKIGHIWVKACEEVKNGLHLKYVARL
ncbi:hypothetical protein NLJ89_g7299 [Agrocybe chaxingu]|uniref:Aminotransferase class V domain-containing protein n=1 Tax=Agrocybe chaxingu TaxID=84603 RepID=A0A9W8MT93_9AGAR|nr:hypothetical protein NLJ89_g7299 [Agrocybe chaxingu]